MSSLFEYRLEIAPSLGQFRNEILFAFNYINRHYGLSINNNALKTIYYGGPFASMPATFFEDYICQNSDGVFLVESQINRLAELWPIGTNFNNVEMKGFDFIGLIFFMLSRIEERNITHTDKHDRFLSSRSLSVKNRWLATPVVDECAQRVAQFITGKSVSPVSKFRVILTHDVDKLRAYHYPTEPLRYMLGDLLKRSKGLVSFKRLLN